ncbi:uncharacterized protein LOC134506124 [Candoia aspera]|uniref:uncharacterized protein LOC134506124 n=1 Tax=Candoia aspera TaxID=51853 RepID=UPI002FD7BD23
MAQNLITRIGPEMFSGFSNLTTLNIASNKIYEIASRSFRSLSKLTLLDLSNNNLTSLTRDVFDGMRKLPVMKLGGNPWSCFCEHQDFVLFLQELINMSLLQDATSVICHSPPSMKGVQVWNISSFNCTSESLSMTLGNSFYQSGLPAVLACLVFVSFILLAFGMWMARYASKRVQPSRDAMEPSSATERKTQLDSAEHQLSAKESENKEIATALETRMLQIRCKSASAILLRKEFYHRQQKSMDANQEQPTIPFPSQNDKMHVGTQDMHHVTGLWNYQKLEESNGVESQSHIKANTVLMEVCRDISGTKVPPEASDQIMQDNGDSIHLEKESTVHPEPFLYLSVTTAPEEQTEVKPQEEVASKKESHALKRSLTWPFERKVWDQGANELSVRESFEAQFLLPPFHCGKALEAEKADFDQEWLHLSPRKEHPLCFDGKQEYKHEAGSANEMEPPLYNESKTETTVKATDIGEMELDRKIQRQYDLPRSQSKSSQADKDRAKLDFEGEPANLPEFVLQKELTQAVAPECIRTALAGIKAAKLSTGIKNKPVSKPVSSQSRILQKDDMSPPSRTTCIHSPFEDDGVLLRNKESKYINLLHEVVENRGRWTRERWKQTHQSCVFPHPPTKSK